MIPEAHIRRTALLMVKRYKADAMLEATARADQLLEDAMIAATARVHRLAVATRNERDFRRLDVRIFNPFKAS